MNELMKFLTDFREQDIRQFKAIFIAIAIGIFYNLYSFSSHMDALRGIIKTENWKLMQCLGDKTKCEVKK